MALKSPARIWTSPRPSEPGSAASASCQYGAAVAVDRRGRVDGLDPHRRRARDAQLDLRLRVALAVRRGVDRAQRRAREHAGARRALARVQHPLAGTLEPRPRGPAAASAAAAAPAGSRRRRRARARSAAPPARPPARGRGSRSSPPAAGPARSGSGPASARGTSATANASIATAATPATAHRRNSSPTTTGSGDDSAAYGVNASSATNGYGTSNPSVRTSAHTTHGAATAPATTLRTRPNLKGTVPFRFELHGTSTNAGGVRAVFEAKEEHRAPCTAGRWVAVAVRSRRAGGWVGDGLVELDAHRQPGRRGRSTSPCSSTGARR